MDFTSALEDANLAVLLSVVVHLTGDDQLLARYESERLYRLREPVDEDPDVAAEIRDHAAVVLRDEGCWRQDALSADELVRIATFCAGEPVDPAYGTLVLEESNFDAADRRRLRREHAASPDAPPDFRVGVIGAGLAGVCAGIRLGQANIPYTIFEKNQGIGGTWWENDYPNLRVDVPSLFYSYSFAPNPEWSDHYPTRDELQEYVETCADSYGVTEHIRFGREVRSAEWDPTDEKWTVRVETSEGRTDASECNVLISAVGMLNRPSVPDIPGLESFTGRSFHSTHWPEDLDVTDRRVGMIGTGASGVQVAPGIAPIVEHLDVFQRSPHWVMPNPTYLNPVSEAERRLMRNVPHYAGWARFLLLWNTGDRLYPAFRRDPEWPPSDRSISAMNEKLRVIMTDYVHEQLEGDDELIRRVLPDYPPLAKRILQDGGWFASLRRPTVDLVTEPIDRIEPSGVVTADGVTHPADVLVLATGFHAQRYLWPMEITGTRGRLHDVWDDRPRAHLGITVPGFPNLFCLYGPNTNPVTGSVIFVLECQVDYVVRCVDLLLTSGERSMEIRQETFDEYNARLDEALEQMVWRHPRVDSYFKNKAGDVVTNCPWRLIDYWRMTRQPDPADFNFTPARERVP